MLACVLLVGLITAQLLHDVGATEPQNDLIPQAIAALPEASSRPDRSADAAASVINARPLFSATRRPAEKIQPGPAVDTTVAPFTRRLTGVVIEPSMRAAVFTGDGKGRGLVVKEGETIEGWLLESVTPTGVTVRAASTSQAVELVKATSATERQDATDPDMPSPMFPFSKRNR